MLLRNLQKQETHQNINFFLDQKKPSFKMANFQVPIRAQIFYLTFYKILITKMLQNEIIYLLLPPQKGKNAHFKPRFFWLAFFQDAINQKIASPS
ncbi:hypothetical protein [Odoribacter lunatus]|uniref:hypothetical protein n=1 Tax=Odoribacter lunatus TaxID=2941335 RepID=UPI002041DF5B|nr:hypothetical protein [Odoribacter lunatus]